MWHFFCRKNHTHVVHVPAIVFTICTVTQLAQLINFQVEQLIEKVQGAGKDYERLIKENTEREKRRVEMIKERNKDLEQHIETVKTTMDDVSIYTRYETQSGTWLAKYIKTRKVIEAVKGMSYEIHGIEHESILLKKIHDNQLNYVEFHSTNETKD